MSIDWDEYEPYDAITSDPPKNLPRREARRLFRHCMDTKPARLELLRRLLKANGVDLVSEDASIQDLNNWFLDHVEADPERPGMLHPLWYSIVHDVALFLGDVMIERHPNLHWEFFTWGKTNVAFQRHVIMGMSAEDPKFHTNIDIDRMVSTYAQRIIEARGSTPDYGTVEVRGTKIDVESVAARHRSREIDREAFWRWLQATAQRA